MNRRDLLRLFVAAPAAAAVSTPAELKTESCSGFVNLGPIGTCQVTPPTPAIVCNLTREEREQLEAWLRQPIEGGQVVWCERAAGKWYVIGVG